MISNDNILNASAFVMLLLLLLWGMCFFLFVYKRLGGPKLGKESFLYFNFMFFKRDVLSNFALIFLVLGYMAAAIVEYRRGFDELILASNLSGGVSFFLFALYGKYFYKEPIDDKKPFFLLRCF
ncbi:hypothetical protein LQ939_08155 [Pantoea alhagi]|uniref:hypothetical protein n=1 Tax=Pantoea alhagi TaxID=1891675 RepID=UPI00202B279D|nr:hypothetical protein [Pantoea alhagi]URQ62207.1 hypothetical protein LQ939_08155 [Pantoea alhagi]